MSIPYAVYRLKKKLRVRDADWRGGVHHLVSARRGALICSGSAFSPDFSSFRSSFFFYDSATTKIYTLSLHDALPISQLIANGECPESLRDHRVLSLDMAAVMS